MLLSVKFTKEAEKMPENCAQCPFVNACDGILPGITKRGGIYFTARALKGRVKGCPLKVEAE